MPAGGDEDHHHMIPGGETRDVRTDLLDHAGGFVTQRKRGIPWTVAVDHGKIRVAQARSGHPDQQFTRAGRIEVRLDDFEWPALGIRARRPHLAQNGDLGLHVITLLVEAHGQAVARNTPSRMAATANAASAASRPFRTKCSEKKFACSAVS